MDKMNKLGFKYSLPDDEKYKQYEAREFKRYDLNEIASGKNATVKTVYSKKES